MQLFPCPFCGPREESEFHYGGEAGNLRPDRDVTAERWADYLHIWVHMTCGEFFAMSRDSVNHKVSGSFVLGDVEHGR